VIFQIKGKYCMYKENEGRGFDSPPREMHKVTCADCGTETEVPFKPDGTRPVYCRECYQKHKPKRF
jgi:CxxC-x17-CxxC domain-containing protein